jgi:hypothetical protein
MICPCTEYKKACFDVLFSEDLELRQCADIAFIFGKYSGNTMPFFYLPIIQK